MAAAHSNILSVTRQGSVAVLDINNPPAQALDGALRAQLLTALQEAEADQAVTAIVIAVRGGQGFVGSDDLRRALLAEAEPTLDQVTQAMAQLSKPIVACLVGRVIGAGASLALAAHWRVAAPDARIGWPEVGLGRVPGGGATQRVPRLIGAQAALDLFLTGRAFPLSKPMMARLVDHQAEGAPLDAAIAFAAGPVCVTRPTDLRRDGLVDGAGFSSEVALRRDQVGSDPADAAAQTVASVEAAILLPIASGLEFEISVAAECTASPTARARHALMIAERQAVLAAQGPEQNRAVAISGAGTSAAGLAIAALDAGERVELVGEAGERMRRQINATYEHAMVRGRMNARQRDDRLEKLTMIEDVQQMGQDALVLVTDADAASDIWPDHITLVATNDDAAAVLGDRGSAQAFVAAPPHARRIVEVRGEQPPAALDHMLVAMSRIPIRSYGDGPSAMLRLWSAVDLAADRLVVAGIPPERIDFALREAGWAGVPYLGRDTAGLEREDDPDLLALFPDAGFGALDAVMVDAGRGGRVSGQGYYDYSSGKPVADPTVTAILSDIADATDPGWPAGTIVNLLTAAMANEGARLLGDEVLLRGADVDLIAVHGLGLPRDSGGPMTWADATGLTRLVRHLEDTADAHGAVWGPHPLWADLIKNGEAARDFG